MRVAIGADHAGFRLKSHLAQHLERNGHEVTDLGTDSTESVDYPDFAQVVAEQVRTGNADRGILICGSGVGMAIAAGKIPGIRASVSHDLYTAQQMVEHDDVNILCLGEKVIEKENATQITDAFLNSTFSGEERHRRRLQKISLLETPLT